MATPTEWDLMRERLVRNHTKAELRGIAKAEGAACTGYKEEVAASIVANRRRLAEGRDAPARGRFGRFGDYARVERVTYRDSYHCWHAYNDT